VEETTKISVGNLTRYARCRECGKRIYLDIGDEDGCDCEIPKMRNWGEYMTICPEGCVMPGMEEACGGR